MAETHTPGPWVAERRRFGSWTVLSPEGFYIVDRVLSITDIEANARLIAAAPELLAALKECRDAVAAAMRVIADLDTDALIGLASEAKQQRFVDELKIAGVKNGFGKRADDLIKKAEGR